MSLPTHKHPGSYVFLLVLEGEEQFAFANTGNNPTSLYVVLNKVPDPRYAQNV